MRRPATSLGAMRRALVPLVMAARLLTLPSTAAAPVPDVDPARVRPIIAAFTQNDERHPANTTEVLAASYVKWVEAAGGRVIPIRRGDSEARVRAVMARSDGLLFPGGGGDPPESALLAFALAMAAGTQGVPVPVWGTCLGFEWIMQIVSGDLGVLESKLDAWNLSLPLHLHGEAAAHSRLLGGLMYADMRKALEDHPLTTNNHHLGISPEAFASHPLLARDLVSLSTSKDRLGHPFISTVEGRSLPIGATQWHPEKALFEWGWTPGVGPFEAIEHSWQAQRAAQHLANVFLGEARIAAAAALARGRVPPVDDSRSELVWTYATSDASYPAFELTFLVTPRPPPVLVEGAVAVLPPGDEGWKQRLFARR
mmetsp:Transcript_24672/g.67126  ORF Transcript_24672/g.67126 Transcript_24672/m.67126 type:complete len:369 (+) Transcript_24672:41-1147(+)